MNRRKRLGALLIAVGAVLALPLIVVETWVAVSKISLILVAPSRAWLFWAVPATAVTGGLLLAAGAVLVALGRRQPPSPPTRIFDEP